MARRPEPETPDLRKQAYYNGLAAMAANANFRTVGLKQFDQWNAMFPTMFEGALSKTPAVSETSAQRISTVFTCLNIHGETVGSLPFGVKKNTPNGAVTEYGNLHRLIHDRPNEYTTAFSFWSTIQKIKLAWGNAYAEIQRGRNFEPVALFIRPSCDVQIKQTPTGEIYYDYKGRAIRSTDMLHFKNYSLDGLCGVSTIRQNALTLGIAMKLNQYNSSIIGERPYGYLTSEKKPKDLQQKGNVRSLWDKRDAKSDEDDHAASTPPTSIAGIPYLYGGLEFKSFTLPADDVAYIESAKLKDRDIFGIFRVQPTMAQDWENAPYNSSEQQDINFVKYSLASIKEIEQECTEKLFPESNKTAEFSSYCKFSLQGLLRGDTNTRKEFYSSGIQNGWLTPNQVCEFEDLPTYGEDGDKHFLQGALVPIDMIAEMILSKSANVGQGQTREQIEGEFKKQFLYQLREKIRPKMNGHWKEIEEFLN